jgi:hypothetical protein
MVLDKLSELFDDKGIGTLKDLADSFGDNKDRIFEAVDWVWDHREEMVELAQKLPELLGRTGESLALAGDGAVRASAMLTDETGDSIGGLTGAASDALDRSLEQIESAAQLMASVGDQVDDIPMLDGIGESLTLGATGLEGIGGELGVVAVRLRAAGVQITDAGEDLAEVGSGLLDGAAQLVEFAGREMPKPKKVSAKPKSKPKAKSKSASSKAKKSSSASSKSKKSSSSSSTSKKSGSIDLGSPS